MSTLSDRGSAALVRRQKLAAGVPVTYTPLATGTGVALVAVPGQTAYEDANRDGAARRVEIGARDYQIAAADLVAAGIAAPAIGDRIADTDPATGAGLTFEIQTPANGEPAFRYASQSRVFWRVHTKRVV